MYKHNPLPIGKLIINFIFRNLLIFNGQSIYKSKFYQQFSLIILFFFFSFSNSTFSQNIEKIDSLNNLLEQSTKPSEKVKLLNELCWKFRNFNPDSAIYFGELAIETTLKLDTGNSSAIKSTINAYGYTGVAYRNKGIYSKALELYYKGAHLAERNNEYELLTYAYINIANIHIYRKDMDRALNFLNKANRNSILVNNKLQESYIYVNLGRVHTALKNYSKAHAYINKSIKLRKEIKDDARLAVCLKYKGDLLIAEKKQKEGLYNYHEALKISEKYKNDKDLISDILHKISKTYLKDGNFSEAERYAKKSLEISEEIGVRFRIKDASYMLAKIFSIQRMYKKAYRHYVTYSDTKDSIFSKESNRIITNMQTDFEVEKQQKENEILKTKRARDKEIIKKREILILSITIGLLLMFIIIFILINSNKLKKQANILLMQKNTEINEQKEKIEQIALELEKVNKTKDRFFSIIAHDLKNPFNTIIGFSNLLKTNIDSFDREKIKQFASTINDTSIRTYELLENLLEWSRSQTNTINFTPQEIVLNTLVFDNINLLKIQGTKKNVLLENNLDSNFTVYADFNMLNTVLRNLISNAIKFTKNGSVKISAEREADFCKVSIEDTGVGISEKVIKKLFEIDQSITTTGTEGEIGTGIGLILCKEFISKNSGNIYVKSTVGKGSKFCFTLPLEKKH